MFNVVQIMNYNIALSMFQADVFTATRRFTRQLEQIYLPTECIRFSTLITRIVRDEARLLLCLNFII